MYVCTYFVYTLFLPLVVVLFPTVLHFISFHFVSHHVKVSFFGYELGLTLHCFGLCVVDSFYVILFYFIFSRSFCMCAFVRACVRTRAYVYYIEPYCKHVRICVWICICSHTPITLHNIYIYMCVSSLLCVSFGLISFLCFLTS